MIGLSSEDAAWVAGFIDGDGCITLNKSGKYRRPLVTAESCDKEILDHLLVICGGFIVTKSRLTGGHRAAWSWRIGGPQSVDLLRQIYPFMRCAAKRARADLLLDEWPAHDVSSFEEKFFAIGVGRGKRHTASPKLIAGLKPILSVW
jgi:hypothetical protein